MRSICDKSCSIALLGGDDFLFFWHRVRRRKLSASEGTHENDGLMAVLNKKACGPRQQLYTCDTTSGYVCMYLNGISKDRQW